MNHTWQRLVAKLSGLLLALALLTTCPALAALAGDLVLSNEYIAITVNNYSENAGRFSIKTTGGDPDRASDDNAHLIYRLRDQKGPWTSFTSLQIDKETWVYGSPTHDTAGFGAQYGEARQTPTLTEGRKIDSSWQLGPVQASQSISFVRSSTTGLLDTARIATVLVNTDTKAHSAGLRLTLDTMLGDNDGAPYRVGDSAITTDTVLTGSAIPDFWQAFDSLTDPKVTAQGTLRGGEVTTPDKVYFTNWASLIDDAWQIKTVPGRDFTREDGIDLDSAMALVWEPTLLQPGERRSYITYVGLGGLTIAPGQLQLAITAPSAVVAGHDAAFPVIVYVQNNGTGDARNVKATISLPSGLKLTGGQQAAKTIGSLPVGATGQARWNVTLDGGSGQLSFKVDLSAMNADSNSATRRVEIISPAQLQVSLREPQGRLSAASGQWQPYPYAVEAVVTNIGQSAATDVTADWSSSRGLRLAQGDAAQKNIGYLDPGESYQTSWHVAPTGEPGDLPYKVIASIAGGKTNATVNGLLRVPPLDPAITMTVERQGGRTGTILQAGESFLIHVNAHNLEKAQTVAIELIYDPTQLRLLGGALGVDRGTIFTSASDLNQPHIWARPKSWVDLTKPLGRVAAAGTRAPGTAEEPISGSILTLRLQAVGTGNASVQIDKLSVKDTFGQNQLATVSSTIQVKIN